MQVKLMTDDDFLYESKNTHLNVLISNMINSYQIIFTEQQIKWEKFNVTDFTLFAISSVLSMIIVTIAIIISSGITLILLCRIKNKFHSAYSSLTYLTEEDRNLR